MAKFLSDDWFKKVARLSKEAGDLNLPPALAELVLNLRVANGDSDVHMILKHGSFVKGEDSSAETTLTLDAQVLKQAILAFDMAAAMEAFMSGKIRVDGDMSKLMALQTAQPSQEQRKLYHDILAI